MRIVSLAPGATEIICALGAGDMLVGRSHECDWPERVRILPTCTRAAFSTQMSSREIDTEVNRRLRAGEPLFHIDMDLIRELKPDVLVAQEHCAVCAVTPGEVCGISGGRIVSVGASSVSGIYKDVMTIAEALGKSKEGDALVGRMQREFRELNEKVREFRTPSVVVLEWTDPLFAMGNWGPELVEAANGRLLLGRPGEHSRAIPWQDLLAADPEYLIIAPCGFDLTRAWDERAVLEAATGWTQLQAVKRGNVFFADGNRYFNRSGMTVIDTAQLIGEILHDLQPPIFVHAWRRIGD